MIFIFVSTAINCLVCKKKGFSLSKTTYFRLFHTKRICSRQFCQFFTIIWSIFDACCTSKQLFSLEFDAEKKACVLYMPAWYTQRFTVNETELLSECCLILSWHKNHFKVMTWSGKVINRWSENKFYFTNCKGCRKYGYADVRILCSITYYAGLGWRECEDQIKN